MNQSRSAYAVLTLSVITALVGLTRAHACTGVMLKGKDGTVAYGRTCEWGAFDLHSRLVIIPRGQKFVGTTPDGKPGYKWTNKYGIVGIDALKKDVLVDAMNETGFTAGFFYHLGFAKYPKYDPDQASKTMAPTQLLYYILGQFSNIKEAKEGLKRIRVAPVVEPALGFPAPLHIILVEPSGKSIVIEFLNEKTVFFENPLGVITNAPTYDWHMTNVRNYINLSATELPAKKLSNQDFGPLGGGSGLLGLPGDFTPPSRFIRCVAFTQTARPTKGGLDTITEVVRILDNFNVPLGFAEGSSLKDKSREGLRSATLWTTAWDLKKRVLYYHTQHNRRLRRVRVGDMDWNALKGPIRFLPLDRKKIQDIEDVTP